MLLGCCLPCLFVLSSERLCGGGIGFLEFLCLWARKSMSQSRQEGEKSSNTLVPENWPIGQRIRISTTLGEELEGEIYCFDSLTSTVVLQDGEDTPTTRKSYRILNTNFVAKTLLLGTAKAELRPVRSVDLAKVRAKEATALAEAQKEIERIGVGVTAEAQRIFNALAKTLPCRWENDVIIVFDDLRIASPYRVEDVYGGEQTSASELNRVKRVLDGETKKLGLSG